MCVYFFFFFGCLRQRILNVTFNFERRHRSLLIYFAFKRHFAQPTKHLKQQSSTDVTSRCAEEKKTPFSPFLTFTALQTEWCLSAPPSTGPQTIRNVLFLLFLFLFHLSLSTLTAKRSVKTMAVATTGERKKDANGTAINKKKKEHLEVNWQERKAKSWSVNI